LKGENKKEESGDDEEGSKDDLRESQEEGTPSSASYQNSGFVLVFFNCYFILFFVI